MFLKKDEKITVVIVFIILIIVSSFNFSTSLRRRRDAQRASDTRSITDALIAYHADFGFYPPASSTGQIVACLSGDNKIRINEVDENGTRKSGYDLLLDNATQCVWGEDGLNDISDPTHVEYLARLPRDPNFDEGRTYLYFSTGRNFQIVAALESSEESEYHPGLLVRGLMCGDYLCNHSRSSLKLPLEMSLVEYENELIRLEGK